MITYLESQAIQRHIVSQSFLSILCRRVYIMSPRTGQNWKSAFLLKDTHDFASCRSFSDDLSLSLSLSLDIRCQHMRYIAMDNTIYDSPEARLTLHLMFDQGTEPMMLRFPSANWLEWRQKERVASILSPENTEEKTVHAKQDNPPYYHSHLLRFRVGHTRHFHCKSNCCK